MFYVLCFKVVYFEGDLKALLSKLNLEIFERMNRMEQI
jgi:hypothetical protein